ncbi:MAG TPA: hypothetical protein VGS06_09735 [Streptosporangiaceae bacterium]|nr:hypothetical protein [Streptosporangiaceae bacterium]
MDAVVIVDPVQYQHRRDERDDVSMPLRSLHFGPDGGGLVTFLVYPPDDLVLVVKIKWLGVSTFGFPRMALCHRARADRPTAVTFCNWHPVIAMESVDRFADRATRAKGAISGTSGGPP